MKAADLDAVTLDVHGTLMQLRDPVPELLGALAGRGVARSVEVVKAGFLAEAAHYAPRAGEGHDEESLARLQRECAGVFLDAVESGRVEFSLRTRPEFANPQGTLHGGILCDIADAAMGVAYASTLGAGEMFTTLELKINFLKPVW